MKEKYKSIIFSILGIGIVGGLVANNIYLNNKIEKYKAELDNIMVGKTIIYQSTDKNDYLNNDEVKEADTKENEITEKYIYELIEKYNDKFNTRKVYSPTKVPENKITYVTNEIKQITEVREITKIEKCEPCANLEESICNHEFDITVSDMTCPQVRTYYFVCKKCGYKYSSTDNVSTHYYEIIVNDTRKTCTDNGVITYKCITCDETINSNVTAKGHKTDFENSYGKYCTVCGKKLSGPWGQAWNATFTCVSNSSAEADVYAPSSKLLIGVNVGDEAWTTTAKIKVILRNGQFEEQDYSFTKDKGCYYNDFSKIIENDRLRRVEITNINIKDRNGKTLEENGSLIVNVAWYDDSDDVITPQTPTAPTNMVTNKVINTVSNTETNTISNTVSNTIVNNIVNEIKQNVITPKLENTIS